MNEIYGLEHQVEAALMEQSSLENEGIEVLDSNGVITLRGTVSTVEARELAEAIARSVAGVTGLMNESDVV